MKKMKWMVLGMYFVGLLAGKAQAGGALDVTETLMPLQSQMVLKLADMLELSGEQLQKVQDVQVKDYKQVIKLTAKMETELLDLWIAIQKPKATHGDINAASQLIGKTVSALIDARIGTIRAFVDLLTPEQKIHLAAFKELYEDEAYVNLASPFNVLPGLTLAANLTEKQVVKLKARKLKNRKERRQWNAQLQNIEEELVYEALGMVADKNKLKKLSREAGTIMGKVFEQSAQSILYFASLLTDEQVKKFNQALAGMSVTK